MSDAYDDEIDMDVSTFLVNSQRDSRYRKTDGDMITDTASYVCSIPPMLINLGGSVYNMVQNCLGGAMNSLCGSGNNQSSYDER
jgi:hypothetical protein